MSKDYECPKCGKTINSERDKHGSTENEATFSMLGMTNIQLKCSGCGTVVEVTE